MRILITGRRLVEVGGGAERSMLSLVRRLSRKHSVLIFNYAQSPVDRGADLVLVNWTMPAWLKRLCVPKKLKFLLNHRLSRRVLRRLISEYDPELVITQKPPIPWCEIPGAATIAFVRDLEYLTFFVHKDSRSPKGMLNYAIERAIGRVIKRQLRRADLVIANSEFVSARLAWLGVEAEVVYPFVELSEFICQSRRPEYITYISGSFMPHKGFLLFLDVARRMPEHPFLAVGRDPDGLMRYAPENVRWQPWTDDMREVYAVAKIVVVPSLMDESFGRTVIEAQANGIPVVASRTGGLPEAVGDAGLLVDEFENPEKWVAALKHLLESERLAEILSRRGREHATKFDAETMYTKFVDVVKRRLGIEL